MFENKGDARTEILTPSKRGIIEPQVYHKVKLLTDDTIFCVEFYAENADELKLPNFLSVEDMRKVNQSPSKLQTLAMPLMAVVGFGILAFVISIK